MEIKFYTCGDDHRTLNKTLEDELTLQGAMRQQASMLAPIIVCSTLDAKYNYCYIPSFGRYYYVTQHVRYRRGLDRLNLDVDVLMSYRDKIMELTGVVSRLDANDYINGSDKFDVRSTHERIDFPTSLELGSYVLTVLGG